MRGLLRLRVFIDQVKIHRKMLDDEDVDWEGLEDNNRAMAVVRDLQQTQQVFRAVVHVDGDWFAMYASNATGAVHVVLYHDDDFPECVVNVFRSSELALGAVADFLASEGGSYASFLECLMPFGPHKNEADPWKQEWLTKWGVRPRRHRVGLTVYAIEVFEGQRLDFLEEDLSFTQWKA